MENEYGSFGADEIDVEYMTHLKTVRKSFYDQESKMSTRDKAFFFGGGGGGGKEQQPKGKKGMPYTISLVTCCPHTALNNVMVHQATGNSTSL